MIWGVMLLILYAVRKFKAVHQYQAMNRESEKDGGIIDEQSLTSV
jgi:hypothetical protein